MAVIARLRAGIASRLRIAYYRATGVKIHGHVCLRAIEIPRRPRSIILEEGAALDRGVVLLATADAARITIGARTYINRHTMIDANESVEIGDDAMIGPFCYITDHDHAFGGNVAPGGGPLKSSPTRVGARCWLGAHVSVLKGVTIGEATVVGAGSVVTKPLPAHAVAVGNPARVVKTLEV